MEEHGFEVVSVYPNSPAARAGLIGRTGSTPSGELKALGSVLLGPVALVTFRCCGPRGRSARAAI